MKYQFITFLSIFLTSPPCLAQDPLRPIEGTAIKEFKGGVTFNHRLHQTERVGKCFVCHDNVTVSKDEKTVNTTKPGKIKGFGKEWAHKYCTDCHDLFGDGPVECNDCHQNQLVDNALKAK